jgi:hypothetical protein
MSEQPLLCVARGVCSDVLFVNVGYVSKVESR